MDNHAEQLNLVVAREHAEEVAMATRLRDLGYLTGTALTDGQRAALRRLVLDGRADDDLTAARRYTITDEGRTWLEKQEGLTWTAS